MDNTFIDLLIKTAINMREKSYCDYSGYSVGAALLTDSNEIFSGCNIENASYGATMCAERTAIYKAVSCGHKDFVAIAIVGGMQGEEPTDYAYPCGLCRQVMSEFCDNEFVIIVAKSTSDYRLFTLGELLPNSFGPGAMQNR